MDNQISNQPKQERSRTRWTASLDKIFADLVVREIQLGNRPNNVFDKKTWNHIREEFNRQTDLNFNNNQLRKHLDVLRTRFYNLKSASVQTDFPLEDPCCIGFNLWDDFGGPSRPETIKVKDCPIYEQLCAIFMDTSVDGKYAQSSHFEGLDKPVGNDAADFTVHMEGTCVSENVPSSKQAQENTLLSEKVAKNRAERKRKLPPETHTASGQSRRDQEIHVAMAEALQEMVAASKWRTVLAQDDKKFTITNCINALDEIEGIDQQLYFAALDLFEEPKLRQTFLSLKGNDKRLTWLYGKYSRPAFSLLV
uniref:L10-interacting MYB domain-containing protein n=1 Tax=Rhizophora mucronata TaxID=61149 RepID=A0A2P2Q6N6_RHIMU